MVSKKNIAKKMADTGHFFLAESEDNLYTAIFAKARGVINHEFSRYHPVVASSLQSLSH